MCYNMDEPRIFYAKWNNLVIKDWLNFHEIPNWKDFRDRKSPMGCLELGKGGWGCRVVKTNMCDVSFRVDEMF